MDDADLDPELLSALRELPSLQDDASQATLDRMEALPLPQLQGALRGFLGGLSREQLDELVATSSEEEDDEEERGGGAAWPQGRVVALTPARVRCGRGHELSAIIGRPADYAGQVPSRPPRCPDSSLPCADFRCAAGQRHFRPPPQVESLV